MFTVTLNRVAVIQMADLQDFIHGRKAGSNEILTSITALNVLLRHLPTLTCPSNARSFFTDQERIEVGGGIELWRGQCLIEVSLTSQAGSSRSSRARAR